MRTASVSDIGVHQSAISHMRHRHRDFPKPIGRYSNSDLFSLRDFARYWHKRHALRQSAHPKRERFEQLLHEERLS